MMNCISLMCRKPDIIWIDFLSKFKHYDIYIIIDDNSIDYKQQYINYTNINFIQINDDECEKNGFIHTTLTLKKKITAWDKALYYFTCLNTVYNQIWFIEDDIFIYNEEILLNIDLKHDTYDLISKPFINIYTSGPKNFWHWAKVDINISPPYYAALMCCIRVSSSILSKIKEYATMYNTLCFHEALIPTLCMYYSLKCYTPDEITRNFEYRRDFTDSDINKTDIYHPIKDISKHTYYRSLL